MQVLGIHIIEMSVQIVVSIYVNNSLHFSKNILCYLSVDIICSKKQTVNFEEQRMSTGQISEHIFLPNGGYCVYYPLNIFLQHTGSFEDWGISI